MIRGHFQLTLKCDAPEHRGVCFNTQSFIGYCYSDAKANARKASWRIVGGFLEGKALCPNRKARRISGGK